MYMLLLISTYDTVFVNIVLKKEVYLSIVAASYTRCTFVQAYADTLEQQSRDGVKFGQPLLPKVIDLLSDEQVEQLCALKDEAEKPPLS